MNFITVDDRLSASQASRFIDQGNQLIWQGDFQNAKQLLAALKRRRKPFTARTFQHYRNHQANQARRLNSLLIPLEDQYVVPLRRAPDIAQPCEEAYGPSTGPRLLPLRELLGVIGAHQLRRTGIAIPALKARIHPHYGVFPPTRPEYVELVASQPLPEATVAFDIGTGTGVLAALLATQGAKVIATDTSSRAITCARDNLDRLDLADRVDLVHDDLFPPGRADLVVCNPPWIPARPISLLDQAVYDEDGRMLQGWINGLADHLTPNGEGWLILSDLAEHLGLRSRSDLLAQFAQANLRVAGRASAVPRHRKANNRSDPLHWARAKEVTSLWRLKVMRS
ncbi:class I SAM-dependent methyltransferase [Kribbella sp. NPDC023855]|uniref:class I SAM-dependent methyltransferase n=1 Tax=Kribbella sp. NPDC023855 TaxID=3154698 RepID=UPI0033FCAA92